MIDPVDGIVAARIFASAKIVVSAKMENQAKKNHEMMKWRDEKETEYERWMRISLFQHANRASKNKVFFAKIFDITLHVIIS